MEEIILRDQNHVTIGAAVTDDASQNITILRVDPSTKYLLVDVVATPVGGGVASQIANRDQNHRTTCMAWDETNGVLQEILTDTDGNLLCDLLLT